MEAFFFFFSDSFFFQNFFFDILNLIFFLFVGSLYYIAYRFFVLINKILLPRTFWFYTIQLSYLGSSLYFLHIDVDGCGRYGLFHQDFVLSHSLSTPML